MVRFGPISIRAAHNEPAKKPAIGEEVGVTGTETVPGSGGGRNLAHLDYNADLRGNKLYDEVDKMRLSDSVIKGMLSAIKLPLLSADWTFEPGDDSPEQQEIADWLTYQLDCMNWSWRTVLRHILLYLDYGSMPFEKVFQVEDDPVFNRPMVHLRKLAPRMPRTVKEWVVDERGGLSGIVQQATLFSAKDIPIPIENLLVFVNELEGANWRGTSILRAARKDWYYKDRFQRLGGIIMEKRGAGIDVGTLQRGDATKKAAAERVLMDVRTHERAFILETDDFHYRVEGAGAGTVLDPLPWVNYCDLAMLRGLLAEFLALGGGDAGSWALSKDKTSFFLMALRAVGQEVCDTFNRHLVRVWCDMNWANLHGVYPSLTHSKLDRRDAATVISAITQLIPTGALTVDPGLEQEMREMLELPQIEEDEQVVQDEETNEEPTLTPTEGDGEDYTLPLKAAGKPKEGDPKVPPINDPARRRYGDWESGTITILKDPTKATSKVNWLALEQGMDSAEAKIVEAVKVIQARQIEVLAREANKRISSGRIAELDQVSVPYKAEVTKAIEDVLLDLYKLGQREAETEITASYKKIGLIKMASPAPLTDEEIREFLGVRARTMASMLSERLRGSMMRNALDMFRQGDVTEQQLKSVLTELSDRAISTEAKGTISESVNMGRQAVADANADNIAAVEYSALLDDTTCDECEDADGKEFEYGSAEMLEHKPPYKKCLGRGRCRCVLIFTMVDEGKPLHPVGGGSFGDFSSDALEKDFEATEVARQKLQNEEVLTPDGEEVLSAYGGGNHLPGTDVKGPSAYELMNGLSRGKKIPANVSPAIVEKAIETMDEAIAANKLSQQVIVYRGVSYNSMNSLPSVGGEFTDAGFVSTSASASWAAWFTIKKHGAKPGALVKIVVPAGYNALSGAEDENEIILPRGTKFRVLEEGTADVHRSRDEDGPVNLKTIVLEVVP